jgi:hypothetical protein
VDVTQLILDDHTEQRRLFSVLEQIPRRDVAGLTHVWSRLASFLELHAQTEEELFYPALLMLTSGTPKAELEAETADAIGDHNEIRDAVAAALAEEIGTSAWYQAVAEANRANSDHMGEEEREGLTAFRQGASLQLRHELGVRFAVYEAEHYAGVQPVDKDPDQYIRSVEDGRTAAPTIVGGRADEATTSGPRRSRSGSLDIGGLRGR